MNYDAISAVQLMCNRVPINILYY